MNSEAAISAQERKAQRKTGRIMRNAFILGGVGLGLLIVPTLFGGADARMAGAFSQAGYVLAGNCVLILLAFFLARRWLGGIAFALSWAIVPALLLKIAVSAL